MAIFGVDLDALAGSAAHVPGQGDDLASAHLASDNRTAGAESELNNDGIVFAAMEAASAATLGSV